ncbi:hypothetical protein PDJAM_G00017610 [Pangasius djambal]|uniref:Uncharacterized protein n=1 Tax=Pangasius djambal TaxID=1691987 RepID=A0ACC5YMF6_9TELE|nr:hypothetical protein [Pangasius djambal]
MPEKKRHLRLLCLADRLRQRRAKKKALAAGPISSPSTDLEGWEGGSKEEGKRLSRASHCYGVEMKLMSTYAGSNFVPH